MPTITKIFYYLLHPQETRTILQWKIWHTPVHARDEDNEPISLKACFDLLDLTSRSFSAVIQELNHELLIPICIFYLVLRGLDTMEDDMTLSLETKDPLLRDFHNVLEKDGWTFKDSGPNEKDRELLVRFHYVVAEFKKLKPEYKNIIKDICKRMGNGMADYAKNGDMNNPGGVNTIKDYTTYCYYVAGLVGEGCTGLFVEGKGANPGLAKRKDLQNSMGQFLQQTNIIRDVREDRDDNRRFWPREIWSKHVDDFDDLFKPEHRESAMRCSSEMILLALERAPDCLFYLAGMREQSVFNFAAIPQSMAIATLELCFRNPAIFERNVKITRGQACRLMIESSQNLQVLFTAFKTVARRIHKKNDPRDPNFLKISVACGKIEQFIESIFPSQDPNAVILQSGKAGSDALANSGQNAAEREKQKKRDAEAKKDVMYMALASFGVMMTLAIVMMSLAAAFGARFDLAFKSMWQGDFSKAGTPHAAKLVGDYVNPSAKQEL